ncbi:peptide/nickel transport system permease protein [Neorhizobium galegae]|uniref:ABC transporter permease n=1 Tax=Neorhizobium galegae TaxID=399 RepID=UPI001AE695F2|nr:ABC transporter permease [Neorhizobium galegae]MBP2562083.1 peptide/nickel transport system permease protein [Neorhizobium galegae]MDQ0133934.1 peptide/nickel transport system permease protein [Neorhizobium galegae]
MLTYSFKRLVQLFVTVLGVVTLVFFTMRLIPGDPISAMAGDNLSGAALDQMRGQMGLNDPLPVQYLTYLGRLAVLDFGTTVTTKLPIVGLILGALPVTVSIALGTIFLTVLISIPLGTLAAYMAHKGNRMLDNIITGVAMVLDLMPPFWTSLVCLLIFSLTLGWFPASGTVSLDDPAMLLRRIALPVLVLSMAQIATLARITRTSVLEVLNEDYVRTARSMGWSELHVLFRHALKNAALPIVTVIGLSFGNLLNGTVIVEFIFTLPGIGNLLVGGMNSRDYQMVQTLIVFYAMIFVAINFTTDLIYRVFDPRVQF